MEEKYNIKMGESREDYTIYYEEIEGAHVKRNLAAALDLEFRSFGKTNVILYLNSFQRWSVNEEELTVTEYIVVLNRIFTFLKRKGYEITLKTKDPIWH